MSQEEHSQAEKEKEVQEPVDETTAEATGATEEDKKEFGQAETADPKEELERKLKEEKDRYLRIYAEFENFRRRNAKERIEMMQSAGSELIRDLLPIMDDFDRAKQSNEKAESMDAIKEGFEILHNKLQNILKGKGLSEMEVIGHDFDSEEHEAIARIEGEKDNKGKIIDVAEKGYKLNDKIIRHPKVVVGT